MFNELLIMLNSSIIDISKKQICSLNCKIHVTLVKNKYNSYL